jgi:hypothetical protein
MAPHLQIRAIMGRAVMTAWGNTRVTARRTARGNACVLFLVYQRPQLFTRVGMVATDVDCNKIGAPPKSQA